MIPIYGEVNHALSTGYQPYGKMISDKIEQEFFQVLPVSTTVWLHHLDLNKMLGEKAR